MTANELLGTLHEGEYTLVIWKCGVHTFSGHGISDLYHIYRHREELLNGALVADKIIGKGAAALMALGNVKAVTTDIISSSALSLLKNCGITVSYRKIVPNIINRQKNGICPVEQLCINSETPSECLPLIEQFMSDKN